MSGREFPRWITIGYLVLLVLACLSVFAGVSLWLPITLAVLPWSIALVASRGALAGVATTVLGVLAFVLVVLLVTHALTLPIAPSVSIACALLGVGGVPVVLSTGLPPLTKGVVLTGLSSLLGGLIWTGIVTLALVIPGATHYTWAMNGDSANNLVFARVISYDHGIALGGGENPVPLTTGLIAIGMASGRGSVPSSDLLAHDMSAFVDVWTVVIASICVLAGLVAASAVPAHRTILRVAVAAAASLLPLSWYIVGYPIEYGFLNTHLALAIVLCAWLVYRSSDRYPAFALGILTLSGTLVLAVWGPLVLFPGGLILVLIIRRGHDLWRSRGLDAMIAIIGVLQLLAYGVAVTLPSFLVQGDYLSSAGGAFPISRFVLLALVVVVVVGGFLARKIGGGYFAGSIAMAGAAVVGMAVLLFAARTTPDPWISYYPLKFSWLAGVALFLVFAGTVTALGARWLKSARATVAGFLVIAAVAGAAVELAPLETRTGYVRKNPVVRVLTGDFWGYGDEVAYRIFDFADLETPTIMWRTQDRTEGVTNFWVMHVQSDSMSENIELKLAAYGEYDVDDIDDLCLIVPLMLAPVTVQTADPGLAADVEEACPEVDARILMVDAP